MQGISWKRGSFSAGQDIRHFLFYGTQSFVNVLKEPAIKPRPESARAHLWDGSLLLSHLRLGLANSLLPWSFPTKTLYA
jgi:hypothetical protein